MDDTFKTFIGTTIDDRLGDDEVERFDIAGSGASSTDARPLGWIDDVPGDDVPGDDVPNHDRATSAIGVGLPGVFEARSFSSECYRLNLCQGLLSFKIIRFQLF